MFNVAGIFTSAWKSYRLARPAIHASGDTATHRTFLRPLFAKMLQLAWADARREQSIAQALVAAQNRVTAAKIAALPAGERSARIATLRDELTLLDYAPLGVRTSQRRHQLAAELNAYAA